MEKEELSKMIYDMKEEDATKIFKILTVGYVFNSLVVVIGFLLSIGLVSYLVIKHNIWFSLLYILVLIVFRGANND